MGMCQAVSEILIDCIIKGIGRKIIWTRTAADMHWHWQQQRRDAQWPRGSTPRFFSTTIWGSILSQAAFNYDDNWGTHFSTRIKSKYDGATTYRYITHQSNLVNLFIVPDFSSWLSAKQHLPNLDLPHSFGGWHRNYSTQVYKDPPPPPPSPPTPPHCSNFIPMFPSVFETSVYTEQATICPSVIMLNPLSYQYPPTVSVIHCGHWPGAKRILHIYLIGSA